MGVSTRFVAKLKEGTGSTGIVNPVNHQYLIKIMVRSSPSEPTFQRGNSCQNST
jgi:hypothetical protein